MSRPRTAPTEPETIKPRMDEIPAKRDRIRSELAAPNKDSAPIAPQTPRHRMPRHHGGADGRADDGAEGPPQWA
ncbi:hypothetical protein GCM10008170_29300 [Methylopila capsulata]|uniref:Uncharacterized protein n=1 Tax=Methylopila capsulata TaxID=61654 RepID=A0A9W6IUP3_9HYPH|nr:hypothetical protein GCM10008170_29300 [Methylopila capsulata]